MKILFVGRRYLYFKNFDSVIRELAQRGHQVHLAVERDDIEGRPAFVDELTDALPNVTSGYGPSRAKDDWTWIATRLRLGLDYLRYQHPLFDDAPKLRDRARERTPGMFVAAGDRIRRYARWSRRLWAAMVRRLETAVPDDPAIRTFIEEQQPDVMLITPLIDLGSSQIDYLRAARSLGVPTAMCVWSWDHLSSKALIRECPDRVFVWNDTQKREAITLHDVPAERIVVTGAQCFDRWFNRQPSRDREAFCQAVGLPADQPFILYVCSALFLGSDPEAPFVLDWIRRVRESRWPGLRSAPILVRPHPSRTREWEDVDLRRYSNVALRGGSPVDEAARADYFDALYHSAAVVGLNTSAFIEAGIVGRPVHTILLPEFYENQMGTVHFRYLLDAGGGLLEVARDLDEHLGQLARSIASPGTTVRPFVGTFVRPHGLDVAATPLFVRAVEEMRDLPRPAPAREWSVPLGKPLLRVLVRLRNAERGEWWLYSERELEVLQRNRRAHATKEEHKAERKAVRVAAKQARRAERELEWARHLAARAAQDAEKKALRRPQ